MTLPREPAPCQPLVRLPAFAHNDPRIAGSSLAVFSGYRFVRRAAELRLPIVVLNRGATRADRFAELKLEGACGALLARAVSLLEPSGG